MEHLQPVSAASAKEGNLRFDEGSSAPGKAPGKAPASASCCSSTAALDAQGDGGPQHRGNAGVGRSDEQEYRPELATFELIIEVRRLLTTERRVERLVCRYLADLADRVQHGRDIALWFYADEFQAARAFFGLGLRDTRERVRVGRALRQLPRIEAAFVNGELSYSRVREVARVAEPRTEPEWLELARTLDMRALERRVASAREAFGTG